MTMVSVLGSHGSLLASFQTTGFYATLSFLTLAVLYLVQNEIYRFTRRIRGLPGPWGWPVVGNLFQKQDEIPAETYRKWAQSHGPVFQIQLGNTTAVIVNTAEAARKLLVTNRTGIMSRPIFYVLHKRVSKAVASIGTSPWDESCRRRRKLAAAALNRPRVESYAPILNLESREFLRDLLSLSSQEDGGDVDFRLPVQKFSLNLSLTLNYGTRVSSAKALHEDPLMAEIVQVESAVSKFRDTSKNYANYIPLLRYWEPFVAAFSFGSSPKNQASGIGERRLAYNDVLLNRLKDQVAKGEDRPCIQGAVLRDPESATLTREELISVSLSMMAGADSNQPTLSWAILLLAHRQDIQEKAFQAVKEAGILNLPSSAYAATNIEYVEAFTREISRYFAVLKLALPKATYTDVEWQGATIPANTLVFLNSWAINRDPALFTDADVFAPERWLPDSPDHQAHQYAFGIGGRMCVASLLAQNALYTVFLHLIAHFHILPATGTTAEEIDPLLGLKGRSFVATPRGDKARFVPRDVSALKAFIDGN